VPRRPRSTAARTAAAPADRAPLLLFAAASAIALWRGIAEARARAWTTDDAYISFRYADHLVRGQGLVFNAGERVEGYSNFLWTLWCALGLKLGVGAETWTQASGIVCYAATIALLCLLTWRRAREDGAAGAGAWPLPLAALGAAFHTDWNNFATSGLETSLFALLAVVGYAVLASGECRPWRAAVAGFVFALATLTRLDGALLAVVALAYVTWAGRPRVGATLACAAVLAAVGVPYALWKLSYYGDLLPNTYYAKSAGEAWYAQGLAYVALYFRKYWVLAAAIPLALAAAVLRPQPSDAWVRRTALALALALVYTWWVARLGGDFMYARLLVPVAALYVIALELALERVAERQPIVALVAAVAAVAGIAFTPSPLYGPQEVRGIVNEWALYDPGKMQLQRLQGQQLERVFANLPVRVAFSGSGAELAYYSRAPVAIDASAGLTDAYVAHLPLAHRGPVGHEKAAPFSYLIDRRRVHFYLGEQAAIADSVDAYVPVVRAQFAGFGHTVLTWDPALMDSLESRGIYVQNFIGSLDEYAARMGALPDDVVRQRYDKLRRFYFVAVRDSAREAPFLARLH